jgi:zinc/manganese transport system permease protein
VVTSSVPVAGVLLVFCYLVVPATVGALLAPTVRGRLTISWAFALAVSVLGLVASYLSDLPTGATVVTTFGALLSLVALGLGARAFAGRVRRRGLAALRGVVGATCAAIGLAGLLLLLFPRMDHHWLNWLEESAPAVRLAFLDADEVETYRDTREEVERGAAELRRLRAIQQEVQWGARQMSEEMQERLRQYLASRTEMVAGDRFVLTALRDRARERQRFWLGVPLLVLGAAGAVALARPRLCR